MKKIRRTAAWLLTLLCASAVPALMTACADSAQTPQNDTAPATDTTAVTETAAPSIYDVLPEKDYGGYEFRVLNNISDFAYTNFGSNGQTGETLDDAIYERNAAVEEALNITLTIKDMEYYDVISTVKNFVMAGEDAYDIYFNELHFVLNDAMSGYLLDLSQVSTLNFDNPWWNKSAIESATIGDPIYAAFGDLHLMYYECFIPVVFNKQILTELDLDDPYTLVRNGTWTLDVMAEMAKAAKNDVDGDGKWTVADRYGIGVYAHNITSLTTAAETDIITKDADNMPVWNGLTEKFVDVYGKLVSTMFADKSDNVVFADGFISENGSQILHVMMQSGQVLFYIEPVGSIKRLRDVDYEIGVVPTPKYDESQDGYRSYIFHGASAMGIPKTNPDTERTGVVAEYLAAYSHETVMQTYFDETLDFKYIQDDEGQAMLDIMFSNGTVELAAVYSWGDVITKIREAMSLGKTDIVSRVEKVSAKVSSAMEKTVTSFVDVE